MFPEFDNRTIFTRLHSSQGDREMAKKSTELQKLNETGRRSTKERRTKKVENFESEDRREGKRRRQIDPTTCERDYSNDEIEFMRALDEYKRKNKRMFPTCSEMLEVLRELGYQKVDAAIAEPTSENAAAE